jgi:diguanylate cyclase (GGDEF)-like protein/PAS domain S-box-containing protein
MNEHPNPSAPEHSPTRLLTAAVILTCTVLVWFGWITYNSYEVTRVIHERLLRVQELQGVVTHLDEVLTMSARMAAATGDLAWEQRYRHFEPILDHAIKEIIELEPDAYSGEGAAETDAANIKLVEMEHRAFDLVRQGRAAQARDVLFSAEYEAQKQIYSQGMAKVAVRLKKNADDMLKSEQEKASLNSLAVIAALPTLLIGWIFTLRVLHRWRARLSESNRRLDQQAQDLRELNAEIGLRVEERTSELRKEIAERRRAEEQLRMFSQAVEQSPASIVITDPTGAIEYVNPLFTRLTGYTLEEAIGKSPRILKSGKVPQETYQELWETISNGGEWRGELCNKKKNGELYWESASISSVRDTAGAITHFLAVKEDITERKRAEEMLRESEGILRTITDSAGDAILMMDQQGRVSFWNQAAERILGHARDEALGRNLHELLAPERYLDAHRKMFPEFQRTGCGNAVGKTLELHALRKDGQEISVALSLSAIQINDAWHAVGILRDNTERKRAEREIDEANQHLKSSLTELERRNQETTLLNEMGDLLLASISPGEAHAVITQYAQRLFPDDSGAVFAISASRDLVEAVTVWGQTPPRNRVFATGDCWALRRGRLHSVDAAHNRLVCNHVIPADAVGYLCVPMMAAGEALGVLHVQYGERNVSQPQEVEERQAESKQRLAVAVAEHLALALANLNLRETLRIQSIRDPLTGLFNRRYMEESLEREIRRAARNQKPLGAIMIDLDHFKRFNDTFGHEAGDTLLHAFGVLLQKRLRGEDIACRYGGEEFVLILPEAPLEVVRQRGDELCERAKHLDVQHLGRALGAVTLSIGIAVFPEHGGTPEAVLRAADSALYRAKKEGRDRVVVAENVTE